MLFLPLKTDSEKSSVLCVNLTLTVLSLGVMMRWQLCMCGCVTVLRIKIISFNSWISNVNLNRSFLRYFCSPLLSSTFVFWTHKISIADVSGKVMKKFFCFSLMISQCHLDTFSSLIVVWLRWRNKESVSPEYCQQHFSKYSKQLSWETRCLAANSASWVSQALSNFSHNGSK